MDDDTIICPCMGTTLQEIREAVKGGADTLEAVEAATGAGTVCGMCGRIGGTGRKTEKRIAVNRNLQ